MERRDISIIIPARNEKKHIKRCVTSALSLTDKVYVVDSFSTDETVEIAEKLGAKVYQYDWTSESNFSKKMNWALDNIPIDTTWVMRLDADEYLVGENWGETFDRLIGSVPVDVNGINIVRRLYFMRKWMRHSGSYPHYHIRIWRYGKARFENRWLDEHIDLGDGRSVDFNLDIADDPIITISRWVEKHNEYSLKEAITIIDKEVPLLPKNGEIANLDSKVVSIRKKKEFYNKFKPYWRGFLYFCYRYFIKMGFLDGKEGFLWNFYQAWWYRNLVDTKVQEIIAICGKDVEKIKDYVFTTYKLKIK